MRVHLAKTRIGPSELEFGSPEQERVLRLASLDGLEGELRHANRVTTLDGARASGATIDALEWSLPGGSRLTATSPAVLSHLAVNGRIAPPGGDGRRVSGQLSAHQLRAGGLALVAGGARVACGLETESLAAEHTINRTGHASAERLALVDVQASLAQLLLRASRVTLERVRFDWGGDRLAGAAQATVEGVTITTAGLTIEIERADLPEGARTSGGALVIPELRLPAIRVAIDDLLALVQRFRRPRLPDAAEPPARRAPVDLGFLDRVTGRLDVNLTADLSLPVLGRRHATHQFRVPITRGVINYRDIERNLSGIEDAFIDLEVRGEALVLERAIPLIPGLEKPLILWDLDAEELELARKRLVRLRTIPRMRFAERSGSGDGERGSSGVALRRLVLDGIDVALTLAAAPEQATGPLGRTSVGELRASGRVEHQPGSDAVGQVKLSAERATTGPLELSTGGARVSASAIEIGGIDQALVDFRGLRPGPTSFTLRQVVLRGLRVSAA